MRCIKHLGNLHTRVLFTVFLLFQFPLVQAEELKLPLLLEGPEAWLVSYAPGQLYWQRFGHNAIWLRDPMRGIDHVFNAGYFDFNQDDFFTRFIQGRMLYFSAAQPFEQEFRQYQLENRSIRIQRLNLSIMEYEKLSRHLLEQVLPENRDYLYDYYMDNCSTRMRDALDFALDGEFRLISSEQAAGQNFRAHTRRSVWMDFAYYLGLELALALPVDREISRWDEMFLPAVLSKSAAEFNHDGRPLASSEHVIFNGASYRPPQTPPNTWWRYFTASILLVTFFVLLGRLAGQVMGHGSVNAWLMISASGGCLLAYLWFLTNHEVAGPNINLLLLNPLVLAGLWNGLRRFAAVLLLGGIALAGALALLPAAQYNLDVLAFLMPVNLVSAIWLWRR